MAKAQFEVRIEEDGKLAVTTGNLAGELHLSADAFVKMLADVMGGPVETKSLRGDLHAHQHQHGEQHEHHKH